jgi:hypothetical protein
MTVTKLRGTVQDYFEMMTGRTIDGVGVFDGEVVIFLDNFDEVCFFADDEGNLAMRIDERAELDD